MATKQTDKPRKVHPNDKVDFTWNGKSKFHKDGDVSSLHPVQAEKMKAKGYGSFDTTEIKKGAQKGKEQDVTAGKPATEEQV